MPDSKRVWCLKMHDHNDYDLFEITKTKADMLYPDHEQFAKKSDAKAAIKEYQK